jgi:hypothetical protein
MPNHGHEGKMMRIRSSSLAAAALAATSCVALAQGRPSTTAMSCAEAQALVNRAGAIVLGTGGPTFERFVVSEQFCTPQEEGIPHWAPTRDNPQCMVGYRCEIRGGRFPTDR